MLIDLKPMLNQESIRQLLSYCVFEPDKAKLERIVRAYGADPDSLMLGYAEGEQVLGCVGVNVENPQDIVIVHFSVDPTRRNQGIGRKMIEELITQLAPQSIEAETDDDTIAFYQRCGFEVTEVSEKYGVKRYTCIRRG